MAKRPIGQQSQHPSSSVGGGGGNAGGSSYYDPLQYKIRASDDRGHHETLPRVQVPPELAAEITAIGTSGEFEFDSVADFIRWASVFGIEHLKRIKPAYPSNIAIIRAMEREHARSETRRKFFEHIERIAKEVFEHVGMGLPTEAALLVHTILGDIRKMDPNDPFRSIYENEVQKRFGHLLSRGKIVGHTVAKRQAVGNITRRGTIAADDNE